MISILRRVAAIGEVLVVLLLGVLAVRLGLPVVAAPWLNGVWNDPAESALPLAVSEALTIAARFTVIVLAGFLILWIRFRISPTSAGVGLGKPSATLRATVPAAALGALPWKALVLWNMYAHSSDGLHAWDMINRAGPRLDVVVLVLATAMLLPPLAEELAARGYMRTRLGHVFGPACGALVAALMFALSHAHFFGPDWFLGALGAASFFAAAIWGWAAWRTGSILPGLIGHVVLNTPEPSDPVAMAMFVGVLAALVICFASPVARELAAFGAQLRSESWAHLLWAAPLLALFFTFGMAQPAVLLAGGAVGFALLVIDCFVVRRASIVAPAPLTHR